jgi:hypothetical protein
VFEQCENVFTEAGTALGVVTMKNKLAAVITGGLLTLTAVSAYAHHSFVPEFDWKKPITITGTVTKFEWTKPHVTAQISVKDQKGTTDWAVELGSPTVLV